MYMNITWSRFIDWWSCLCVCWSRELQHDPKSMQWYIVSIHQLNSMSADKRYDNSSLLDCVVAVVFFTWLYPFHLPNIYIYLYSIFSALLASSRLALCFLMSIQPLASIQLCGINEWVWWRWHLHHAVWMRTRAHWDEELIHWVILPTGPAHCPALPLQNCIHPFSPQLLLHPFTRNFLSHWQKVLSPPHFFYLRYFPLPLIVSTWLPFWSAAD